MFVVVKTWREKTYSIIWIKSNGEPGYPNLICGYLRQLEIGIRQKIAQKCQKLEVVELSTTRCGFSQKWPNIDYSTEDLGVFIRNFW